MIRPGGELRFYEHVRAHDATPRAQPGPDDRWWPRFFGGCHPNRDTPAAIEAAGFDIERCDRFSFRPFVLLKAIEPHVIGVARRTIERGDGPWLTTRPRRSTTSRRSCGAASSSPVRSSAWRAFGMQVIDMPPGYADYPEHDHAETGQEEVYVVLRGSAEMDVDGERVQHRPRHDHPRRGQARSARSRRAIRACGCSRSGERRARPTSRRGDAARHARPLAPSG